MTERVNAWPIRLFDGRIVESAANTYSEISFRMSQNAISVNGKIQGIEICKIISTVLSPDAEAGETNQTAVQITMDSHSVIQGINKDRTIWDRRLIVGSAGDVSTFGIERTRIDDLTIDGKGVLVWDRKLHAAIIGVGNSNAKILEFAAFGYLVESGILEMIGEMT